MNVEVDTTNPVIKLCMEGSQAELKGQKEFAFELYKKAWDIQSNNYEACVAAHYVARFQENEDAIYFWNNLALKHANLVENDSVKTFYPSLYINLGDLFEKTGKLKEAKKYFDLAISSAKLISENYAEMIEKSIINKISYQNNIN